MRNTANKTLASAQVPTPAVQLQSLCNLLNDAQQPERRDAFRVLVKRWLDAGSSKKMMANDPGLWLDVSEAWKPYFAVNGTGAVWSINPIPSQTKIPSTPEGWAIRHLALLMLNPLRDNLRGPCQRPGCQRYYIKKRKTKVYCSKSCGNVANATRSNAALGKIERQALLKLAAKFWPQWTPRKHPNRSFWIAGRVNGSHARMRTKNGWKPVRVITRKWATRNAVAIQRVKPI
jgi:hypothetical protein